jgi:dihydrodipicolinate synthase/N-acetylneuraminate lyase
MGIPAVKVALSRVGQVGGPVRLPLLAASDADIADVDRLLRAASLALVA